MTDLEQLSAAILLSRIEGEIEDEVNSGDGVVPEQYVVQGWLLSILGQDEAADRAVDSYGRLAAQRLRDLGLA